MDLKAFMADTNVGAVTQHRVLDFGSGSPKSNYIAVVLVVANSLPDMKSSYTYGTGPGTTVILDGDTIVGALKNLAFNAKAWFFGDGMVNGKSGKPKEMKESVAYGSRLALRTTGEVAERAEFAVDDTFLNIDFWNSLRSGTLGALDIYLFTNRTVQVIRYATENPVFADIGAEIAGNYEQDIAGGFAVDWIREGGQLSPFKGVKKADLKFELMKYTFGAPTPAPTGLTLITGTTNRYTMAATAAKFQRVVNEPGAVRYSIYKNTNEAIPTAEPTTINTDTGEINILTTLPAGRYVYTIAAENATGVYGSYQIEIVKA